MGVAPRRGQSPRYPRRFGLQGDGRLRPQARAPRKPVLRACRLAHRRGRVHRERRRGRAAARPVAPGENPGFLCARPGALRHDRPGPGDARRETRHARTDSADSRRRKPGSLLAGSCHRSGAAFVRSAGQCGVAVHGTRQPRACRVAAARRAAGLRRRETRLHRDRRSAGDPRSERRRRPGTSRATRSSRATHPRR